ncbi:hypothetical protein AQI70_35475 [Streptomyces curacoi]|uniref:Uncharacterized protein n=1 Tax=Streptomyces curacoi TaxID=146536 RepID=A0A124GUF9_9ACTN|nr:hypothetical protein AQI70_35475 [Streptomyces curacoi]
MLRISSGTALDAWTPSPFRTYIDEHATRLWPAGPAQGPCVVSVPGGARPVGVAMSTTDNRNR